MDIGMDIKEIEAFVYVIDNGSFSVAAKLLHLTQPTISAHIASLERKLGVQLIARTTKETHASDAGRILYGYAKEILRQRERAVAEIEAYSRQMRGTVSVAVSEGAGREKVEGLLRQFREKYPEICFDVCFGDCCQIPGLVASRKAELGFCEAQCDNRKCVWHTFVNGPNGGAYHVVRNKNNVLPPIAQAFYEFVLPYCTRDLERSARKLS